MPEDLKEKTGALDRLWEPLLLLLPQLLWRLAGCRLPTSSGSCFSSILSTSFPWTYHLEIEGLIIPVKPSADPHLFFGSCLHQSLSDGSFLLISFQLIFAPLIWTAS